MRNTTEYQNSLGKLRDIWTILVRETNKGFNEMVNSRDAVFDRYQTMFSMENLEKLIEEEFKSFLLFENNHHWSGLHRQGARICSDMNLLKQTIKIIIDENRLISERLNEAINKISGMGKAIITAILHVIYPDKYGVWNSTSEGALVKMKLWPKFKRGDSFGEKYVKINLIFNSLKVDLHTDLWLLDALFFFIDKVEKVDVEEFEDDISKSKFGLEKYLHEFLRDNWDHTELAKEWDIYSEHGDLEVGYKYTCDIGQIDILAKHKKEKKWLVIELKRDQSNDATVGQVLRYVGWVKKELADSMDEVIGMIISHKADMGLYSALSATSGIDLLLYEVDFHLKKPHKLLK